MGVFEMKWKCFRGGMNCRGTVDEQARTPKMNPRQSTATKPHGSRENPPGRVHFHNGSQDVPAAVFRPGGFLAVAGGIEAAKSGESREEVESHPEPNKT